MKPIPHIRARIWTFAITYLAIASRHTAIQSWSMVKPEVRDDLNMNSTWLGTMDFTFLLCYATGNFVSGNLGDHTSLSAITAIGIGLGGCAYFINALLGKLNFSNPWIFAILFGLQGAFQSSAWPASVAIMGNWFPKNKTGRIVGFWSSNTSVGHLLGAQLAGFLLVYGVSWEIIISISATFMICVGLMFWFYGKDRPPEHEAELALLPKSTNENKIIFKNGINFWKAWTLPGVLYYSLCYACVKMLNYAILMWLPYFLDDEYHIDKRYIGLMANIYDLASIVGAFGFGWLTDKLKARGPTLCFIMLFSIPTIWCFHIVPQDLWYLIFGVCTLLGALAGTAGHLISAAVPIDIGKHEHLEGNEEALATVAGIVDGTGGLGAAFGQILIGYLASYDWMYAFIFMLIAAFISLLLLIPISIREYKEAKQIKKV